jgi:hypothetical protein
MTEVDPLVGVRKIAGIFECLVQPLIAPTLSTSGFNGIVGKQNTPCETVKRLRACTAPVVLTLPAPNAVAVTWPPRTYCMSVRNSQTAE